MRKKFLKKYHICNGLLFLFVVSFFSLSGQENKETIKIIGAGYGQHWLTQDTYRAEYNHYWSISINYSRNLNGSSHWWFAGAIKYSRIEGQRGHISRSFDILNLSPGIRYSFNKWLGLMLSVDLSMLRLYNCLLRGKDCYSQRSVPDVSYPELAQPVISIPLNIPIDEKISIGLIPGYSTGSFKEPDNAYGYFNTMLLVNYKL